MEKDPYIEYIINNSPSKEEIMASWDIAIGLQEVDGKKTSNYLNEIAKKNINGDISFYEAKDLIEEYYKNEDVPTDSKEADIVSNNIMLYLLDKSFSFSPLQYIDIHKQIFNGVYDFAGEMRDYNITKKEWILDGDTVTYGNARLLKEMLEYDFKQEKDFNYSTLQKEKIIKHIAKFIANVWQIHPFPEGNTRTTATFLIKYLRYFGYSIDNTQFKNNSWYFRNALVRANYNNEEKGIRETTKYLELFLRNLLLNENNDLKNRYLHISFEDKRKDERKIDNRQVIEEIKKIRKQKGLTQAKLAKRCNVPQSTIGRIENYTMNPTLDMLLSVLYALDLELSLEDKNIDFHYKD